MLLTSGAGTYAVQVYGMAGSLWLLTGNVGTENQWDHWALVWSGSAVTIYINGKSTALSQNAVTAVQITGNVCVGGGKYYNNVDYALDGYVDEFRVSQGIARWSHNFTLPAREY